MSDSFINKLTESIRLNKEDYCIFDIYDSVLNVYNSEKISAATLTANLSSQFFPLINSGFVHLSGDSLTGPLTLNAPPTNPDHLTNKAYVDARLVSLSTSIKNNLITNISISSNSLTNNSITTDKISNSSISTDKIIDSSITTEKISNNSITSEKIINNSITSEKISSNSITLNKLNPNVVNVNKGLNLNSTTGIEVKLDSNGGLMFNTNGEIKLAPVGATSSLVVVRPSEPGSTDNYNVTRTTVNGELRPCFRTLTVASAWARNNITGNYTILIDEDTIEGENCHYVEPSDGTNRPSGVVDWTWSYANFTVQYHDQTTVDRIFGTGSGMKAGVYCWPRIKGSKMEGGISFAGGVGNNSQSSTAYITARYPRGTGEGRWWDGNRYFDEEPRAVNYNIYITNDINLDWSSAVDDLKWGLAAGRVSNWTRRNLTSDGSHGFCYIRNAGITLWNSRVEIRNINFVNRNNCNDQAITDVQKNSFLYLGNVTLTMLGEGFWNYSAIRVIDGADLYICGERLKSRVTNELSYPGYGLALVGNTYTPGSPLPKSTMLNNAFYIANNAKIRLVEYNGFQPNISKIQGCVLMDGDFCLQASSTILLETGGIFDSLGPYFLVKNLNLRGQRYDDSQSDRISKYSNTYPTFPMVIGKACVFGANNADWTYLRKWTLDGSTTSTDMRTDHPIPSLTARNPAGEFWGSGQLTCDGTRYYWIESTHQFITGTLDSNLYYSPISNLPRIDTYYTFSEGGNTYALKYGTNARL
jgi:hypothetical protein